MSIAFIYNVFDGCELLESALKNSKNNNVDMNIVVYQDVSYYGHKLEQYDINEVMSYLQKEKLIDKCIKYIPTKICQNSTESKKIETHKYNLGLQFVKENRIEYFAPRAIDEFFIKEEFEYAFDYMKSNNYVRAFCPIQTYSDIDKKDIKSTDKIMSVVLYRTLYADDSELGHLEPKYGRTIGMTGNFILPDYFVDSVVGYGVKRDVLFDKIRMHHYRLVRLELKTKLQNSSIKNRIFLAEQIHNIETIKTNTEQVENIFDIDMEKFKKLFCK